jgi:hypothetical protein
MNYLSSKRRRGQVFIDKFIGFIGLLGLFEFVEFIESLELLPFPIRLPPIKVHHWAD